MELKNWYDAAIEPMGVYKNCISLNEKGSLSATIKIVSDSIKLQKGCSVDIWGDSIILNRALIIGVNNSNYGGNIDVVFYENIGQNFNKGDVITIISNLIPIKL